MPHCSISAAFVNHSLVPLLEMHQIYSGMQLSSESALNFLGGQQLRPMVKAAFFVNPAAEVCVSGL